MDIPLIRNFAHGYEQGVKHVNADAEVFVNMTGTTPAAWNDPAKGAELAQSQFDRGADVVYAAAGGTGLGVLQAAADSGKLSIGVDSNQNYLHPGSVLTSMLKRVDVAVYNAFKDALDGTWQPGMQNLGLAEDGVGYALDENNRELITPEMESQARGRQGQDHRRRAERQRPYAEPSDAAVAGDRRRRERDRSTAGRAADGGPAAGGRADRHRQALRAGARQPGASTCAIPAGTIHGIVGENGAGKSTLMNILYGFYQADRGSIRVDGQARRIHEPGGRDRGRHRHGPPALHAGRAVHGAGERAARRRGRRDARRPAPRGRAPSSPRSSASTASRSTSTRWSSDLPVGSSSGSRS